MSGFTCRQKGLRALKNLLDYAQDESVELDLPLTRYLIEAAALAVDEEIDRARPEPVLRLVSVDGMPPDLPGQD